MTTIQSMSKAESFVCTRSAENRGAEALRKGSLLSFMGGTRHSEAAPNPSAAVSLWAPLPFTPPGPGLPVSENGAGGGAGFNVFHKELMSNSKYHASIFTCKMVTGAGRGNPKSCVLFGKII